MEVMSCLVVSCLEVAWGISLRRGSFSRAILCRAKQSGRLKADSRVKRVCWCRAPGAAAAYSTSCGSVRQQRQKRASSVQACSAAQSPALGAIAGGVDALELALESTAGVQELGGAFEMETRALEELRQSGMVVAPSVGVNPIRHRRRQGRWGQRVRRAGSSEPGDDRSD